MEYQAVCTEEKAADWRKRLSFCEACFVNLFLFFHNKICNLSITRQSRIQGHHLLQTVQMDEAYFGPLHHSRILITWGSKHQADLLRDD